jgi:protein deglycase
MATVLVIVAPGAEEIETIAVPDILVRGGHQVTLASTAATTVVNGSRGLPLAAHTRFAEIADRIYDIVYLPGGMGSAETCRDDARIQDLAEGQLASGRLLVVMCACPLALLPRHLATGRRLTSHPSVRAQIEPHCAAWLDQPVVVDDNLITSQGAGTALTLGFDLLSLLANPAAADHVAAAMVATR